jgi:predicted metal-dependent phosphoesterase TrpH
MRTDLHIHTVASDGCWTPERLIVELQARGIGFFAVADLRLSELEEWVVRPK